MPFNPYESNKMVTEDFAAASGWLLNQGKSHGSGLLCMTKALAIDRYALRARDLNSFASNQLIPQSAWISNYQTAWNTLSIGSRPFGIILDSLGNCYVSYYDIGVVSKITTSGTVSTFATTNRSNYGGIAIDLSNNIYVCGGTPDIVQKITPAGVVTTLGTTGSAPYRMVVDASGNVYVTNYTGNNVSKITPSGVSSIFASTGLGPYGITIDSSGNLYVTNARANNISKITPAGVSSTFANTGAYPQGIVIDSNGNLYTCNSDSDNVSKITPAGTSSILGTTGRGPACIVLDSNNDVYVTNQVHHTVTKITQAGVSSVFGYTMSQPQGIAIDTSDNIYATNTNSNHITKLLASDASAPTAPTALAANTVTKTEVNLTWSASTDNVEIRHYLIYRNGSLLTYVWNQLSYNVTELTAGTNYNFTVYARDARGNLSGVSNTVNVTTTSADTTPPSTPVNVYANQAGASDATIGWDPSTDNVGVVSYQVHRSTSGATGLYDLMGTVGASPFTDSGLLGNVEYWYKIRAIDAANNLSAFSIEAYLYMLT